MDMSPICRCGVRRDARGMCAHCDSAMLCTKACAPCRTRDSVCQVCRMACGTPAAAESCTRSCRAEEQRKSA